MVNEAGRFPELCKKSVQAQAGDMAGVIDEEKLGATPLRALERMSSRQLEQLGRISFPMIARRGATHLERIRWDDAFATASDHLRRTDPSRTFFYSSGRSSNEAAFLFQLIARAYGTANVHNCSYYCHSASGVALSKVYGSSSASIVLDDLAHADLALVAGSNPASNHPRLITQLVQLRRRGGRVIVVNPMRELGLTRFRVPSDPQSLLFGSQIADLYLQPHVGGDVALFVALLKGVIETGGCDRAFIESATEGFENLEREVRSISWPSLREESGLSAEEIERTVRMLRRAERGIFLWAMGLTHHVHGTDNVLALANLALARGWLGRPGTGLLPVRGHSNVQGIGSVGVTPALRDAFAAKMNELYGVRAEMKGMDTYRSMEAAHRGEVDVAVLLGGNLFSSNPDRDWARDALDRVPLKVHLSTKLNEGHLQGRGDLTLILPVLARDEESSPTTQESMFNYVRLSAGGTPSVPGEMRSEVEILAELAQRILPEGRFDWTQLRSHSHLREQIAQVVPGFGRIGTIESTGEFQIDGRTFHEPRFATPSGRARFHVTPLPPFPPFDEPESTPGAGVAADNSSAAELTTRTTSNAGAGATTHSGFTPGAGVTSHTPSTPGAGVNGDVTYRLMTLRSEGQFNTVVYEEEDLYRGNKRRDVVMMSERDAAALGVSEGDPVTVESSCGRLDVVAAIVDIRDGSLAMYYPEANVLVPRRLDPSSGTPAFKSVCVRLRRRGSKGSRGRG